MAPIHILDLNFLGLKKTISAFLVETNSGPAIVETGPHSTIARLETAIRERGYELKDVKHVFLTHIHLDHAGAAWQLAENGASVYLHPVGIKHMADPSRLIESAKRIYKDQMDFLWGQLRPVPLDKLVPVEDGEEVRLGDVSIKALHTPGHAIHHIAWELGDAVFTGDVAGVKIEDGPVVPPCPPPDIDLESWQASVERLLNTPAERLYLTHFGIVEEKKAHLAALMKELDAWAHWVKKHMAQGMDAPSMTPLFQEFVADGLKNKGLSEHQIQQYEAANPSWMSVAGLMRYWSRKAAN